jgi:hypothetical protein
VQPLRRPTRTAAGRLNSAPLAGLLPGVLGLSLPDAAQSTLQASMGSRPVTRLAQQQPDLLNGDHQLRELLRLAAALEANGDTAQVVRL